MCTQLNWFVYEVKHVFYWDEEGNVRASMTSVWHHFEAVLGAWCRTDCYFNFEHFFPIRIFFFKFFPKVTKLNYDSVKKLVNLLFQQSCIKVPPLVNPDVLIHSLRLKVIPIFLPVPVCRTGWKTWVKQTSKHVVRQVRQNGYTTEVWLCK